MSRSRRARRQQHRQTQTPASEPAVSAPPVATTMPSSAPRRRKWRFAVLVLAGILLIGAAAWFRAQATSDPLLRMPSIEPEGLSPNVAEAIHEGQVAILNDPNSADAWGTYGLVLLAHEFRREALTSFQEAERLAPEDYRWSYYLGMTQGMSDAEKAAAAFERAVRKAPERNSVRLRLAEWYFDLRRLDACQQQVQMALKQQPDSPRAQLIMAHLYYERGDMKTSLEWALKAANSPRGNRRDVHELLARLYQRLGDRAAARTQVQLAEKLPLGVAVWNDPEMFIGATYVQDASVLNALAAASRARGDLDRCLQLMYQVVEFDPRNVLWKEKLARTLIVYQKYEEALRFLQGARKDHPASAELALLQGRALLAVGKAQEARVALQEAVQKKPDYGEALDYLGRVLNAGGDFVNARQAWQKSLALQPDDVDLRIRLAKLLQAHGDLDGARQQLLEARKNADAPAEIDKLLREIVKFREKTSDGG